MSAPTTEELKRDSAIQWADCGHMVQRGILAYRCGHPGCGYTFHSSDCTEALRCSDCDEIHCGIHLVSIADDSVCAKCKATRDREAEEERRALKALEESMLELVGKLSRVDRHEAYAALQRMSLEVLTA